MLDSYISDLFKMVEASPQKEEVGGEQENNPARESMAIEDPSVYAAQEQQNDLFTDQSAVQFSVRDP